MRFQLSGAVDRAYDFILSPEATRIEGASDAPAAAILICDTETFILGLYRRASFALALAGGHIALSGDENLAHAFARAF